VRLVGFIIRIYRDARSAERQITVNDCKTVSFHKEGKLRNLLNGGGDFIELRVICAMAEEPRH